MNLLLDTHALAWWVLSYARLSLRAREAIQDYENDVFVSSVSIYEMSRKHKIGKWPEIFTFLSAVDSAVANEGFSFLDITSSAALLAANLPSEHRDPFDRMIASQAILGQLKLVTNDGAMVTLGATVLW
jgi:PIN domain nuclease of toxin-antitoxin system